MSLIHHPSATMSDEGEKTCPLCAEEMDLTDQQLRPCKCGYDICVWCWHHIMDMAEKDATEGRCPACRTPYNKEKIVGTASKCERLVAEMTVEKKQKSHKGKTKSSEGRKQLSSVRVIQRNLVYIVGLPLNLADEDLLQGREYFGQYGKVLKVSISRTATGAIQHFANNTCSVYITYSKEDEAVRSIQSVHGFVLEGRPLRACFGTTKYCHAWLRSMPCTNPDCLYLHEFGSQEDSFTKDEIISEYTRGRVQQVTGATNEMQRRAGNILPPAADDYSNNNNSSWPNSINKNAINDSRNSMKNSPPNSSPERSVALPAAASWGTHASNSQPLPNSPRKQKVDSCSNEILNKYSDLDFSNEETIHQLSSATSSLTIIGTNHVLQPHDNEKLLEPSPSEVAINEVEEDLLSFNDQRLNDPEVITHTNTNTGYVQNTPRLNNYTSYSHSPFGNQNLEKGSHKSVVDLGENSIISNILSMDFDPWDESLTSPQNPVKQQSRFSFARDDEFVDHGSNFAQNLNEIRSGLDVRNISRDFVGNTDVYHRQLSNGIGNGFSSFIFEESDCTASNHSSTSSNKISVSRSQISAPPGFMGPSRAPPPGFTTHERMDQTYDNLSGNHMFDTSSLLPRKVHNQTPAPVYNGIVSELEFMDPAILAVGGVRSQLTSFENDNNRLQILMQNQKRFNELVGDNLSFAQRTDSYGVPSSRILQQNNGTSYHHGNFQQPTMMMSNGMHYDGWNDGQSGNNIAMADLLRNERLGFNNKYYSGYEDRKFRVPSSGDVYNRTFGI